MTTTQMPIEDAKHFLASVALVLVGIVASLYLSPVLWLWFVVPLGAPVLGMWTLAGLELTIGYLFLMRLPERKLHWDLSDPMSQDDLRGFRHLAVIVAYRPMMALLLAVGFRACS